LLESVPVNTLAPSPEPSVASAAPPAPHPVPGDVPRRRYAWPAAAVTIVLWATAFPAIRVAVEAYDAPTLTALRLLVASLALGVAAPRLQLRRPTRRDAPLLLVSGVLGMAGYQLLLNMGEETVPASTASLTVATAPAYSVLLAAAVLRERLTWRRLGGVGVGFTGAALIALGRGGNLHLELGTLLLVGAALAHGSYHVAHRPLLTRYSGAAVVCYATWAATLLVLPLLASVPRAAAAAPADATLAAIFLGVGPPAVAFATWAYAVHRLGVGAAATSLYLVPAVALPVSALWLSEVPHLVELAGGALALAGVAIANRRSPTSRTLSPRAQEPT
jgi:terminal-alkyne amino-acid exporter